MSANFGSVGGHNHVAAQHTLPTRIKWGILSWSVLFAVCGIYLGLTVWMLPAVVPVKLGLGGDALGRVSREFFLIWTLALLLGLNSLVVIIKMKLSRRRGDSRLDVPWRGYWSSSARRRTEAVQRLQEVMVMVGFMVNGSRLISYHLVLQHIGSSLGLSISTSFGLYMILVGAVVLVYGAITYFHPP